MVGRRFFFVVVGAAVLSAAKLPAQTYRFDGMADTPPQPADTTDWFVTQNWGEAFGGQLFDPISPLIPDPNVRVEIQTSTVGVNAPEIRTGDAQAQQVRIGREGGAGLLTMSGGTLTLNNSTPTNRFRVGSHDPEDPNLPLEERNSGEFIMSGGTLNAPSLWVGSGSYGEMNMSGGAISTTENLYMDWTYDAHSVLNVSGGTINVGGVMRMFKNSAFNLSGGQVNIVGTAELGTTDDTQTQTPNVSVTITDGLLSAGGSLRVNGSVQLNGGTLRAGSFLEFFSTPGSLKLNEGGTLQLKTSSESVASVQTLISNGYIGTNSAQGTGAFEISVVNLSGTDYTQVTLPPAGPAGDFDLDGDVDGADFLAWQRGFPGTYSAADLTQWKTSFGAPPSAAMATAVPEPSALAVSLVGLVLMIKPGAARVHGKV